MYKGVVVRVGGKAMLSLGPTAVGAGRGLTVKGARLFDARGDLLAQPFGVAPQPFRLVAQALQFFQTLFVLREHDPV